VTTIIYSDGTNIDLVGNSLSANAGSVANTLALRDSSGGLTSTYFNSTCDRRLKKNFRRIKNALERLDHFSGNTFELRATGEPGAGIPAQDFQRAIPEGVREVNGLLCVDPMAVLAVLTEALREEKDARLKIEKRVKRLEQR
jgi:hypothetical protein